VRRPLSTAARTVAGVPAAETAVAISAFFGALAEAFPGGEDLSDRLTRRHDRLVADQQHRVVDEASRYNLSLTLAVLAAYRELNSHSGDELIPAVTLAFVGPMEPYVCEATRAVLDAATDPFPAMVES
jgi:hypothetical protein